MSQENNLNRTLIGLVVATLAVLVLALTGCSTTTTTETKTADMATKVEPTQRAQIHTERSAEWFRNGRLATALEAAQQAVAAQSSYAPAHSMLALIYMELRDDAKAQASFEQALRLAPADSDTLNNYGWFICERQDPKRSLPYFNQALRNPLYSTPERALYNAGVCSRRAGDIIMAETNLRAALVRDPQLAAALYELADIAFSQMRYKEADAQFARFSNMVREPDVNALLLGAKISRAMGDRNAEAGYISQLRRRFPDSQQAREASGR